MSRERSPTNHRPSIGEETFVETVIPDNERRTGRLVTTWFGPAVHQGTRGHKQGFPTSHLRTSGVIDCGGN